MEYPKINLSLQGLKTRESEPLEDLDLQDFKFHVDIYQPGVGGSGHFHDDLHEINFQNMDDLCTIVANQSDIPAEAFYYQDAMATCDEITQELRAEGTACHWKDQMIMSDFTGKYPARARVCYYQRPADEKLRSMAVLRDGTTIEHFRPLQSN